MRSYPVDIDPEQVVRWIMAERQATPSTFLTIARRSTEVREIPTETKYRLGDQEREDLSEVATVATLEIAPIHASDGWRLTVIVEDEAGPRMADDDAGIDGEEELELSTFYEEFIHSGRGSASVVVEAADPAAEARVTRLLKGIETDRHGASGRR
jgi:hypothetical protein